MLTSLSQELGDRLTHIRRNITHAPLPPDSHLLDDQQGHIHNFDVATWWGEKKSNSQNMSKILNLKTCALVYISTH